MDCLMSYMSQFGDLDRQHIDCIKASVSEINLKKGQSFSEAGKIPQQVGFILEGVMRGHYYNRSGLDITRCFVTENSLVVDYVNFESNTASTEYIQACTDVKLMVFGKLEWEQLSEIPGWDVIKSKMAHHCMYDKSRKGPVVSQDATTRYLEFMRHYPKLMLKVPLVYIASYLGVTQQSLSRIRKNIK